MAESQFTLEFKITLAKQLNEYFTEKNVRLTAKAEYPLTIGQELDKLDVGITKNDDPDPLRVVGIELEVISDPRQIQTNYDKFRNWVHQSKLRKGGLLHMFADDSRFDLGKCREIIHQSYIDSSKNHGFCYEFMAWQTGGRNGGAQKAEKMVRENWEFDVRLFALISKVMGKRYADFKH